jgi:hypothetical protein
VLLIVILKSVFTHTFVKDPPSKEGGFALAP